MSSTDSQNLQKTALHDLHVEAGAKMVPFAGYSMPLNYPTGIMREHLHTRAQAGLFDVSHMGQVEFSGNDPAAAIEKLVPADVTNLKPGRSRCTVLLNKHGGIIDDMIITRPPGEDADGGPEKLSVVFNASRKRVDCEYLEQHLGNYRLEKLDDRSLIAVQGPAASTVLSRFFGDEVTVQPFMSQRLFEFEGAQAIVSRCGYTGEDGYEISIPSDKVVEITKRLLAENEVELTGLGARDSLRMEAGLCLYGNDIDETTTPVEANLSWMIAKARRERGGFPGAEIILKQLEEGAPRKRVGIRPEGRVIARAGTEITTGEDHAVVGKITSGCFGPTVQGPVAIAYVNAQYCEEGTALNLNVRGKSHPAQVAALPFVKTRYYQRRQNNTSLTKRG